MKEQDDHGFSPVFLAAERLAEVDALSRSIRQLLEDKIAEFKAGGEVPIAEITKKLNELQAAHLKVLAAEDAFHAKIGKNPDDEAIDFDAVRVDVGCLLDRLRTSLLAEEVPCDAITPATGDAPVSVRVLGDAASDTS